MSTGPITINLGENETIRMSVGFRSLGYAVWLLFSQGAEVVVYDETTKQWGVVTSIKRGPAPRDGKRPFIIQVDPCPEPAAAVKKAA